LTGFGHLEEADPLDVLEAVAGGQCDLDELQVVGAVGVLDGDVARQRGVAVANDGGILTLRWVLEAGEPTTVVVVAVVIEGVLVRPGVTVPEA
jgi:hypothetical protein